MARHKIEIVHDAGKPVAEMFAALADHNNLSKVFGLPCKRVRDGSPDVNGVGSVRKLGVGPLSLDETVTAVEPNRSIDYRITRGGWPLSGHRGTLRFSSAGGGSRVEWTIEFDAPPVLGPIVRKALDGGIRKGLRRIS